MDIPTRDTFAYVQFLTREKTMKKVTLVTLVLRILRSACVQGLISLNYVPCLDKNECVDNTNDCSAKAVCTNTEGSFTCGCKEGYQGDGRNCTGKIYRYL